MKFQHPKTLMLMILKPRERLTQEEVQKGLDTVLQEGLTTEAMTTLTGGTFLVAFALLLGANNFQIGLLASLPTFTNIFQLTSVWLIRRYNNRRAVSVACSVLARIPLIVIGFLPFIFPDDSPVNLLLFFLFFFFLDFGFGLVVTFTSVGVARGAGIETS